MNEKTTILDRVLQIRWLSHLIFWGGFLFFSTLLATLNSGTFKTHLINHLVLLPSQMLAAYTLIYLQVQHLLFNKKYVLFLTTFVSSVYLFAIIARISIVYIAEPFIRRDFEQESILEIMADPAYLFAVYFPAVYITGFIMLALKVIKERFQERHLVEVLRKEKVSNELKFLKAQIHPHFLFNTLNNLYALTLVKSDAAPRVVAKLSEILDYILYQCNDPQVLITKEIELIENYIELEMLRYGNQLTLSFEHKIENNNARIAPLLLLALVENAFKHGGGSSMENAYIRIELTEKNGRLLFSVNNSKPNHSLSRAVDSSKQGIGIHNVQRQLDLYYPNAYTLQIEDAELTFLVHLEIELRETHGN